MLLMEQGETLGFHPIRSASHSTDALFLLDASPVAWRAALEITAANVAVRHPRCANERRPFCDGSLAWK